VSVYDRVSNSFVYNNLKYKFNGIVWDEPTNDINRNVKSVYIWAYLGSLMLYYCRSQWPRSLRYRSAAAVLLRLWLRIPPGACMFVCCECCALSGRGLCDQLITSPEVSYWLWCVCTHTKGYAAALPQITSIILKNL